MIKEQLFDEIQQMRNEVNVMDKKLIGNESNIVFYTDEEGNIKIWVVLQNEDV